MKRSKQTIVSVSCTLLLLMATQLSAGIAEFNEAMKKGDYQAAAAEAVAIWENFDKDGKQTAVVAREFGFVNYLARDYENAEMFAGFLVNNGQSLATPDNQPATSSVLLRLSQFSANRDKDAREALQEAVAARLDAEGVDQISLLGAETLFRNDWAAGQWAQAKEAATVAGQLYARAGAPYVRQLRETEVIAAASDFLQNPNRQDYDLMVAAHNRIVGDLNQVESEALQQSLLDLKWRAQAWAHTMEAYFHATYSQSGSIINARLKRQDLAQVNAALMPRDTTDSPMPVCGGKLDVGDLTYPQRWAEQRLTGTAILRMDFDDEGNLVNSQTLAEAPPGLFSEDISDAASSFTWETNPGVDTDTCRLQQSNTIAVIGFWQNCADVYTYGDCRGTVTEAPPQPSDTSNFN